MKFIIDIDFFEENYKILPNIGDRVEAFDAIWKIVNKEKDYYIVELVDINGDYTEIDAIDFKFTSPDLIEKIGDFYIGFNYISKPGIVTLTIAKNKETILKNDTLRGATQYPLEEIIKKYLENKKFDTDLSINLEEDKYDCVPLGEWTAFDECSGFEESIKDYPLPSEILEEVKDSIPDWINTCVEKGEYLDFSQFF